MSQKILFASEKYVELDEYFISNSFKKIFLVCGKSIKVLRLNDYFTNLKSRLGIEIVKFDNFQPNPTYESVVEGVDLFNNTNCDLIVAVGGGSAMDVAKCIKLYSNMNHNENYLKQTIIPNAVPFLAVPTTAGTGSEVTRYAVIYYEGAKQSVADYSCIPAVVLFDSSALKTLPAYQKKATMLDALCHSIEAFWSVNSSDESKEYSTTAIKMIFKNMDSYFKNEDTGNKKMLEAANYAGKAINITQTTAGHAMCYKLTCLYGISHGHAAALCVSKLWPYMYLNIEKCTDSRGKEYLKKTFMDIAISMGCNSIESGIDKFDKLLSGLEISAPTVESDSDFDLLKKSVNPVRLKNNPVELTEEAINNIYHTILRK